MNYGCTEPHNKGIYTDTQSLIVTPSPIWLPEEGLENQDHFQTTAWEMLAPPAFPNHEAIYI